MGLWVVWLIVAVALGAAEIATITLGFGLVAVAALIAAGVAGLGFGLGWQLAAFLSAAAAGLGLARPIAVRHVRQPPILRSGTAALIGQTAQVLEDVTPRGGRVRIGGEEWSARPYDESSVIPAGAVVDVLQIKGATALVHLRG